MPAIRSMCWQHPNAGHILTSTRKAVQTACQSALNSVHHRCDLHLHGWEQHATDGWLLIQWHWLHCHLRLNPAGSSLKNHEHHWGHQMVSRQRRQKRRPGRRACSLPWTLTSSSLMDALDAHRLSANVTTLHVRSQNAQPVLHGQICSTGCQGMTCQHAGSACPSQVLLGCSQVCPLCT